MLTVLGLPIVCVHLAHTAEAIAVQHENSALKIQTQTAVP